LKGEYPPKGVAKVTLSLNGWNDDILHSVWASKFLMSWCNFFWLTCSSLQWQLYACNTKLSSGPTWASSWRHFLPSFNKNPHQPPQSQPRNLRAETSPMRWDLSAQAISESSTFCV
jgi:hypothetical protein